MSHHPIDPAHLASLTKCWAPRAVRMMRVETFGHFRLKVYSIAYKGTHARPALIDAARHVAEHSLRTNPTAHTHYGVGFLGIHDGRNENQIFLDLWIDRSELLHRVWVSPIDHPEQITPPSSSDFNSVCVWDLGVQAHERIAWIRHVIARPEGPDLEGYLADGLNAEI